MLVVSMNATSQESATYLATRAFVAFGVRCFLRVLIVQQIAVDPISKFAREREIRPFRISTVWTADALSQAQALSLICQAGHVRCRRFRCTSGMHGTRGESMVDNARTSTRLKRSLTFLRRDRGFQSPFVALMQHTDLSHALRAHLGFTLAKSLFGSYFATATWSSLKVYQATVRRTMAALVFISQIHRLPFSRRSTPCLLRRTCHSHREAFLSHAPTLRKHNTLIPHCIRLDDQARH